MKQVVLGEIKRKSLPILKKADVKKVAIFGSYARGEHTATSDIDILVDLPRGKTLLDLVGLEYDLEEALGKKVDVLEYEGLKPRIKDPILSQQFSIL